MMFQGKKMCLEKKVMVMVNILKYSVGK